MSRGATALRATEADHRANVLAALRGKWADLTDVDWPALLTTARAHRVEQFVYAAMMRDRCISGIPAGEFATIAARYQFIEQTNALMLQGLHEVLERLRATGVAVVVLKGAALAPLVYGDLGLRPMVDVDLLVKAEDAQRASSALLNGGYKPPIWPELRPGFDLEFRVEAGFVTPGPVPVVVELHWRPVGPLFVSRYVDEAALWGRTTPVEIAGSRALVLGHEDWILHQAAHAVLKHRSVTLLDLCDVDRLVRRFADHLDWGLMLEIALHNRWLVALAVVLGGSASAMDTPVPEGVLEQARTNNTPFVDRVLERWWCVPGRHERLHVIPDWLTLPTTGGRLRLVRSYLLPCQAYLEARFPGRPRWCLPLLHLRQLLTDATAPSN